MKNLLFLLSILVLNNVVQASQRDNRIVQAQLFMVDSGQDWGLPAAHQLAIKTMEVKGFQPNEIQSFVMKCIGTGDDGDQGFVRRFNGLYQFGSPVLLNNCSVRQAPTPPTPIGEGMWLEAVSNDTEFFRELNKK